MLARKIEIVDATLNPMLMRTGAALTTNSTLHKVKSNESRVHVIP